MNKDKIKPTILPGFMELLPREQLAFNSMVDKIRESFELFGFLPIDTVVIEKAEVLTAKGAGETERQIYSFKKGDNELALRFDLTVPLARYVSQNFNELTFPFRRYQIGKVYRGEKPQKGRFREFYQCDIDIVGSGSLDLVNDAEIPAVIYFVFNRLDVGDFQIKISNRKILAGISKELGLEDKSSEILRAIDKIDKTGEEVFVGTLRKLGLDDSQVDEIDKLVAISGESESVISDLMALGVEDSVFVEGVEELKEVSKYIKSQNIPENSWKIDLKIARGLEYYTGTVYETILTDYPKLGSVCGGGRYDNLAEFYTDKKLPRVGISIGLTRFFYMLNENNLIEKTGSTPTKFLILPLDVPLEVCFDYASKVRLVGVSTEVYTQKNDLRKMLDYANKMEIPYVGIVGNDELENNSITVKNMDSGEQKSVKADDLGQFLSENVV